LVRIAIVMAIAVASATVARADSPPCRDSIDGHVVDRGTHEPVAGALVAVDGVPVAQTDEDGRFTVTACPPSAIDVERADYVPARRIVGRARSMEIELELGGEVIVVEGEAPPPAAMGSTAVVSGEVLDRNRGRGFSDTLAEVPGVTQLRTGSGMAKPIVRGQYGRRLLILVDGVRHRGQEWGLDHAPEIDPFVADAVTVVRGAAGVRHGPDAIGGAVLVHPPPLLGDPGTAAELHVLGAGPWNGRGVNLAARVDGAPARLDGLAWQLQGSVRKMAAPTTPDYPLDNTGAEEWNLGATVGYRARDAEYRLSYLRYQARLGVCTCVRVDSSEDFFAQVEREAPIGVELYRSDFEIERAYQDVAHDLGLARGSWTFGRGTLGATYALQYDHRREYDVVRDATTGPQFDFRLTTHDLDVAFEHYPIHVTDHLHLRGAAGVVGMAQVHAYRGLPLVPDHEAWGAGAHVSERLVGHDFELEAGLRYDLLTRTASIDRQDFLRLVRSDQIAEDACGAGEPDPVECDSTFHTISASIGALRQLTHAWAVKAELSTASRPPNPDEQYLNGTSPTFPVLGLGKPDLGAETTYAATATTTYQGERVAAEASVYANRIADYIDFAPALDEDGEPIFDVLIRGAFPRFVTRPVDAVFYGADGGVAVRALPWLELGAQLAVVRAKNRSDGGYLVFVPPDRLRASATATREGLGGLRKAFASISVMHVAEQTRFDLHADLAPPPDAYTLLGGEIGLETGVDDQRIVVALQGTNLTDARYRDYTSLMRYFADQPGRQLMLRLSLELPTE
jgi:iron complex outermembrane receptor protein